MEDHRLHRCAEQTLDSSRHQKVATGARVTHTRHLLLIALPAVCGAALGLLGCSAEKTTESRARGTNTTLEHDRRTPETGFRYESGEGRFVAMFPVAPDPQPIRNETGGLNIKAHDETTGATYGVGFTDSAEGGGMEDPTSKLNAIVERVKQPTDELLSKELKLVRGLPAIDFEIRLTNGWHTRGRFLLVGRRGYLFVGTFIGTDRERSASGFELLLSSFELLPPLKPLESADGRFYVEFPAEAKRDTERRNGFLVTTFDATTAEGDEYTVFFFDDPREGRFLDPARVLDDAVKNAARPADRVRFKRTTSVDGYPAMDYAIQRAQTEGSGPHVRTRSILVGQRSYGLLVVSKEAYPPDFERMVASFRVLPP